MDLKLKTISTSAIDEAIAKAELYRSLNEPEEAESICRDILVADPNHQIGRRLLGLAITDQFGGEGADRYTEAAKKFSLPTTTTRSCAGTAASACSRAIPISSGAAISLPSRLTTVRPGDFRD